FPRILLIRGRNLKANEANKLQATYGPFPQASTLREALKIIRKIFPFRDTCKPFHHSNILENIRIEKNKKFLRKSAGSPRKSAPKPCFGRQIGLCPGVCTGEISEKEYQNTIRNIKLLFEGKKNALIKKLTREMNAAARKKEFERAGSIKKTLFALKHIQDVSLIMKPQTHADWTQNNAEETLLKTRLRVEGYDVAHMAGKHMVGVMVVVEDCVVKKGDYRKFNINTVETANDVGALKEIIERRLAHTEWPLPRLFVVDGGKAQINAVENIFKKYEIKIPIVGVVKDEHHRPKNILGDKQLTQKHEKEILLVNSEAHRFAIAFHKKKRKMTYQHT
ncbi:MAG: UvrB/UvrC motif-containing protein, partial [Parcubacteria group bacterium]|nr:UvrB/UvrC motif-containing protein [Parcubacteria group bacterium]